ncbi:MAG: radical SAM protein [Synergistales bacterium]
MPAQPVLREIQCKSALNRTGIPGYDYCLNPYVGCTHGCVYCYASFMSRFTDHTEKWGEFLDIKVNFAAVLARQLASGRKKPAGKVLVGTVTDAYQPAEADYGLTRSSLESLADYQLLDVHLLTKSALVRRDIAILRRLRSCEVGFTITTMDRKAAEILEPGASPPDLRLAAARDLLSAGIPVWVFIAPLLPGLTDSEQSLASLYGSLREAGIREARVDHLNPYPAVVHRLESVYRRHFPWALPVLRESFQRPKEYRERIDARILRLERKEAPNGRT